MIVVNNTKELEQKYNLYAIPDDEMVMVLGGLANKEKYNREIYQRRITYTGRQIKQIIEQMQEIESAMPDSWNDWQKAKYIYETLGNKIEYNRNKEEYKTQQPSNLTVILSRKAICAGYSLLYKEMMDRQGISCDYIRGRATNRAGKTDKHAWNVLQVDGQTFPVDLTWDSGYMQTGEKELNYFGCDTEFLQSHVPDNDEINYQYYCYKKESINSINTQDIKKKEISEEQKIGIINLAIEQNYEKFKSQYGEEQAKKFVKQAIKTYITQGKANVFTRQGMAREQIKEHISQNDMMELLIKVYVQQNETGPNQGRNVLNEAVQENLKKYNRLQVEQALRRYIFEMNSKGFTRENNARKNIEEYMTQDIAIDTIIENIVERELELSEKTIILEEQNLNEINRLYFDGDEFAQVKLSEEKSQKIIPKAMQWIKERTKTRNNEKNSLKENNYKENFDINIKEDNQK